MKKWDLDSFVQCIIIGVVLIYMICWIVLLVSFGFLSLNYEIPVFLVLVFTMLKGNITTFTTFGTIMIGILTLWFNAKSQRKTDVRKMKVEYYHKFLEGFTKRLSYINMLDNIPTEIDMNCCIECNRLPLYASKEVIKFMQSEMSNKENEKLRMLEITIKILQGIMLNTKSEEKPKMIEEAIDFLQSMELKLNIENEKKLKILEEVIKFMQNIMSNNKNKESKILEDVILFLQSKIPNKANLKIENEEKSIGKLLVLIRDDILSDKIDKLSEKDMVEVVENEEGKKVAFILPDPTKLYTQ